MNNACFNNSEELWKYLSRKGEKKLLEAPTSFSVKRKKGKNLIRKNVSKNDRLRSGQVLRRSMNKCARTRSHVGWPMRELETAAQEKSVPWTSLSILLAWQIWGSGVSNARGALMGLNSKRRRRKKRIRTHLQSWESRNVRAICSATANNRSFRRETALFCAGRCDVNLQSFFSELCAALQIVDWRMLDLTLARIVRLQFNNIDILIIVISNNFI